MTLSCLSAVKRSKDNKSQRPAAPPLAVFAGFTGDRSGSMASLQGSGQTGLYNWIKETCASTLNKGSEGRMFVTTFDDVAEKKMVDVPMKDVTVSVMECHEWMRPRGLTKLFDTAIQDLARLQSAMKAYKAALPAATRALNPRVSAVWALLTDGQDNQSTFNASDMNRAVTLARKNGVMCFFLAANQDAMVTGATYGFNPAQACTFRSAHAEAAYAMGATQQNMAAAATRGVPLPYTQLQRDTSCPSGPGHQVSAPAHMQPGNVAFTQAPSSPVTPPASAAGGPAWRRALQRQHAGGGGRGQTAGSQTQAALAAMPRGRRNHYLQLAAAANAALGQHVTNFAIPPRPHRQRQQTVPTPGGGGGGRGHTAPDGPF